MDKKVQLITYTDRLGAANLAEFRSLFGHELTGLFGGVHILPFYFPIDGSDAGFDPVNHLIVDPRLGNWDDIKALSKNVDVFIVDAAALLAWSCVPAPFPFATWSLVPEDPPLMLFLRPCGALLC